MLVNGPAETERPAKRRKGVAQEAPKAVVLDIEGTVAPISFVYDVMFPYAKKQLQSYLEKNWASAELQAELKQLQAEVHNYWRCKALLTSHCIEKESKEYAQEREQKNMRRKTKKEKNRLCHQASSWEPVCLEAVQEQKSQCLPYITANSLCNDCFVSQELCAYIKVSLLRGATVVRSD